MKKQKFQIGKNGHGFLIYRFKNDKQPSFSRLNRDSEGRGKETLYSTMVIHFKRVVEDFVCINCGYNVAGEGYTNHCPKCLYSVHVDESVPGDRVGECKGIMKPMRAEVKGDSYILWHKCVKCGKVSKNKTAKGDEFEEIVKLANGS